MGTFVNTKAKKRIDISDRGDYVIVRERMDFATQSALERDLLSFKVTTGKSMEMLFSKSGQNLAILKHNVVGWGGPMFTDEFGKPVPCTAENIDRLDPLANQAWIAEVADIVSALNKPQTIAHDPENIAHDPNELAPDNDL